MKPNHNNIIAVLTTIAVVLLFVFNLFFLLQVSQNIIGNLNGIILQATISCLFCFLSITTLIQFFFFKDLTYLLYTFYLQINLCYFIIIFSSSSGINEFVPIFFKEVRYFFALPLLMLSYFVYTHFAIYFLSVKEKDNFSFKWLSIFSKIYLVLLTLTILSYFVLGNTNLGSTVRSIFLIACMPIGIISIVIVYLRLRNIITHILCIGSLFFFIGSVLGFLYAANALPYPVNKFPFNHWVFYTELGTILEIIMFFSSFALRNKFLADEEKLAQQKLQLIRDEIARDLHDDIGASLSNIGILNELAKRNSATDSKASEYLNKVTEDIQHVSESLSDIVWNVNPKYDDINNLFIRMKRYAADMLDGKDIKHEIEIPLHDNQLKLTMDKRKDLYFIFKEGVNNLAKYSKAKHALIALSIQHNKLLLTIKDDGIGFEKNTSIQGNGLHNMRQRAENIGAEFHIESTLAKGTSLQLKLNL